jgi:hypothetical protein
MGAKALVAIGAVVLFAGCTGAGGSTESPPASAGHGSAENVASRPQSRCVDRSGSVRLEVSPCVVASGENPHIVLINDGPGTVSYNPPFKLERMTDSGWRWINRNQAFTLPLFGLGPGKRSGPESVAIYRGTPNPVELTPGVYRVSRGVGVSGSTVHLRVRFRVVEA